MLKGQRSMMVTGAVRTIYDDPETTSRPVVQAEAGVIGELESCNIDDWCQVEINDISGDAIKHFLKWIKDPVERKVILAASLPRALNLDIVAKLLEVLDIDKTEATKYYDLLNQQPFVQQRGDIKNYHPVVKDQMLTYQFNTSPETWRKQHYIIAEYFHQEAKLLGFETLKTQYNNPKWIQLTIEATYHQLCANFEKELPNAVERMVIHLENERTFQTLIPWADTIAKAGKLVNEEDWSLFIQKGVSGLIANDETIGLAFFERINQQDWIKNNLARPVVCRTTTAVNFNGFTRPRKNIPFFSSTPESNYRRVSTKYQGLWSISGDNLTHIFFLFLKSIAIGDLSPVFDDKFRH